MSSVALTFFAFLGFGLITFTAKDLADPASQLPRAVYLALGIATVIYVAVALGVFGTLTVDEVISSGGTALAVAAEPTLGRAGYWLMSVTALFATAGATNSGLYPAAGAIATTVVVLVAFTFTTLVDEPATAVTLVAIVGLSIMLDIVWKRRARETDLAPL